MSKQIDTYQTFKNDRWEGVFYEWDFFPGGFFLHPAPQRRPEIHQGRKMKRNLSKSRCNKFQISACRFCFNFCDLAPEDFFFAPCSPGGFLQRTKVTESRDLGESALSISALSIQNFRAQLISSSFPSPIFVFNFFFQRTNIT